MELSFPVERFFPVPADADAVLELFFPVPADSVDWVDGGELLDGWVPDLLLVLAGDATVGGVDGEERAALANFQMLGLGFPRFFSVAALNLIQKLGVLAR